MPRIVLSPFALLVIALAVTLAAALASWLSLRPRRRALAALAREWGMHYAPHDRFSLAKRVAQQLPIAGAADVLVRDLIYGTHPSGHHYFFRAEFTIGVVRAKHRRSCVGAFIDPKGSAAPPPMRFASDSLSLIEQYRSLNEPAQG